MTLVEAEEEEEQNTNRAGKKQNSPVARCAENNGPPRRIGHGASTRFTSTTTPILHHSDSALRFCTPILHHSNFQPLRFRATPIFHHSNSTTPNLHHSDFPPL
jgi:hypothetical protein